MPSLPRGTPGEQRPSPGRELDPRGVDVRHRAVCVLLGEAGSRWLRRELFGPGKFQTLSLRGRHGTAGLRSSGEGVLSTAERPDVGGGALRSAGDVPSRLGIFIVVMSPRPAGGFPPAPRGPASRGSRSVSNVVFSCWSHHRRPGYRRVLPVSFAGPRAFPSFSLGLLDGAR